MVQINVSQQLKSPIGTTRDYNVSEIIDMDGYNSTIDGKVRLMRLIIYENVANVLCGLFCGVTAALVAIWPALREAGGEVPVFSLSVILVSVALCGILYIYVAAALALAGELLPALRNE